MLADVERIEALRHIARELKGLGFDKRGQTFRVEAPTVVWLVDLEQIPRTDRVGISVGVCPAELAPDGWPSRANDCPIVSHSEAGDALLGLEKWRVGSALDMSREMSVESRTEELSEIARSIARVAREANSLDVLKRMYAAGRFREFLHKDARALLAAA